MEFSTLYFLAFLLSGSSGATPLDSYPHSEKHHAKRAITPVVAGTPEVLGVASDPALDRDSCTSVRVDARSLWTCRDTSNAGTPLTFFVSSTASWSDFNSDGTPKVENGVLSMYGSNSVPYFTIGSDLCGPGGNCDDGTRYAIWPNSRPLPVTNEDGSYSLYTWINQAHLQGLTLLNPDSAATLYRSDVAAGDTSDALPPVTVVDETFWPAGSILYGNYGFVVYDNTAYLYGALSNSAGIAVAKVPVGSIEDKSAYSYFTNSGGWSTTAPGITDTDAAIPNAGTGGQGTFYYSSYFGSFVWIGAPAIGVNADFYIATAPSPEGPWSEPVLFYSGAVGTAPLPAYSQQAHPDMSEDAGNGKDIYLTYTKVDDVYSTPLIHVVWE